MQRHKKGFTLVELLVILGVIAIIFIAYISKVDFATDKAKYAGVQTDFRSFMLSVQQFAREQPLDLTKVNTKQDVENAINKNLDKALHITDGKSDKSDPWGNKYTFNYTQNQAEESITFEMLSTAGTYTGIDVGMLLNDAVIVAYGANNKLTVTTKIFSSGAYVSQTAGFSNNVNDSSISLPNVDGAKLEKITVETLPTKMHYVTNDKLDRTGLKILAHFSNGERPDVTNAVIIENELSLPLNITQLKVSFTYGDSTVVENITGITVANKSLTGLAITNAPTKVNYIPGENFDSTGMVVFGQYNDGSTAELNSSAYSISDGTSLLNGQTFVTVSYSGFNVTQPITVSLYNGAKFTSGDYEYSYNKVWGYGNTWEDADVGVDGWGVRVIDKTKSSFEMPLETIAGKPVISYQYLFAKHTAGNLKLVGTWSNANVVDLEGMFQEINNTSNLDLSNFYTPNVEFARYVFMSSNITTLNISNFNTSKISNMASMFMGSKITDLNLASFNMAGVGNTSNMFNGCTALSGTAKTQADADKLMASTGKPAGLIFYVLATDADFNGTTNGSFRYVGSNSYVEIPHVIKGVAVNSYNNMFQNSNVTGVKSTNKNVTSMYGMFMISKASHLDLRRLDTSTVTSMSAMFNGSAATSIDFSNFDTSKVTNMSAMFENSNVVNLDIRHFNTSNVTNMSQMFNQCKSQSIKIAGINTSNVTNMAGMFSLTTVTTLDLSGLNTSKVSSMNGMFSTSAITSLDLSSFNVVNVFDTHWMFQDCIATTGYARTVEDANKLNSTLGKPAGLTFVVK